MRHWFKNPKRVILTPMVFALALVIACGGAAPAADQPAAAAAKADAPAAAPDTPPKSNPHANVDASPAAAPPPARRYYGGVYAQVHCRSLRIGLARLDEDQVPRLWTTLRRGGLFFVPLVVLTAFLLAGYTPTMAAVWGTVSILAVAGLRKHSRVGPVGLFKALAETSYRMVPVAGACAAAGLVIAGITMTGLALKFAHVIYAITDAQLFPSLLIAAALTIVLGLGMPTPSAYVLAAVLLGPLLADLEVPVLSAHLFLLYYAVMSAITPPVAVAGVKLPAVVAWGLGLGARYFVLDRSI